MVEILNELDDNMIKARKLVDNFKAFKEELGEEKALRAISQMLTAADFSMLSLIKELKVPSTEFDKRRQEGGWDNT